MSVSVDWGTKVITVLQTFLSGGGGGVYGLDVDAFRLALKDLEDSEEGMPFPDTHRHNTEVVLGGVTYARVIEIINGYTITFEDGQYIIDMTGANHNLIDVANLNQVSLRSQNSAGLIVVTSGSGVTEQDKLDISDRVWDETLSGVEHNIATSAGRRLRQLGDAVSGAVVDASPSNLSFISDVTNSYDNFYNDQYLRFTSGNLEGIVRIVRAYDSGTKRITVEEPLPVAPANGDDFDILPVHIHPMSEMADVVLDEVLVDHQDAGSLGEAIEDIRQESVGKWEFNDTTKQLTIYDRDGVTPRIVIEMQDADGNPTLEGVYKRIPQ